MAAIKFPLASFALLIFTFSGVADDWPQWRGHQRDNLCRETGLLKTWPAGGPKLLWKTTGIGSGYSDASIAKGKIYAAGEAGDAPFIHALDLSGKKLWSAKLGRAGNPDNRGAGPRSTPTVDG